MKYYAVTDDPNELVHWGIKGMKWGVRRTDAQLGHPRHTGSKRPRSAAYKRAQNKLSAAMRNGIQKVETKWKVYNSPAQKYERKTNRAIEKARKGKLKYGKLSDDQVRRVTERLYLERQARQFAETEKTFGKRLRESIGQGVISGVGSGVGNIVSEKISRKSKLKTDRMRMEQQDDFDRRKEKRRIKNAQKEAERKAEREFEQQKRKDEYEYERDQSREQDRLKNLYDYGASYDKEGKLDYSNRDNLESYYKRKYLDGETRQQSYERQSRESARNAKEEERQKRITAQKEENRRKAEYAASAKRIEAQQREYDRKQEQARALADKREAEAQAKRRSEWAAEKDAAQRAADKAEAWKAKEKRLREAREKEQYRSNVKALYEDRGRHTRQDQRSGPRMNWSQIDAMERGSRTSPISSTPPPWQTNPQYTAQRRRTTGPRGRRR